MKKAVFVNGGTVGSGLAIAERFAKEGYAVIITSREESRAQAAAKDISEKYGVYGKGFDHVKIKLKKPQHSAFQAGSEADSSMEDPTRQIRRTNAEE